MKKQKPMTVETKEIKTYSIKVECDNCDDMSAVQIPFGQKVSETDCEECGCKTLRRYGY